MQLYKVDPGRLRRRGAFALALPAIPRGWVPDGDAEPRNGVWHGDASVPVRLRQFHGGSGLRRRTMARRVFQVLAVTARCIGGDRNAPATSIGGRRRPSCGRATP